MGCFLVVKHSFYISCIFCSVKFRGTGSSFYPNTPSILQYLILVIELRLSAVGTLKETLSILAYGFTEKTPAAGLSKRRATLPFGWSDGKYRAGNGRTVHATSACSRRRSQLPEGGGKGKED